MKKLAYVLTALLTIAAPSAAYAAWSPPKTLGTVQVVGNPSCASAGGTVVCAAQGFANTMVVNTTTGVNWSGWTVVAGGFIASDPSCADDGNGNVVCAARHANGRLVATRYNAGVFSALIVSSTARIASKPSCATLSANNVMCVARNPTGGLVAAVLGGTVWSAGKNIATVAYSPASCASDRNGRVICMFLNNLRRMRAIRFEGAEWSPELDMGQWQSASDPYCTELASAGRVMCFLHWRSNGSVYPNEFVGGTWSTANWSQGTSWQGAVSGLTPDQNVSCAATGVRRIVCAVRGNADSAMWAAEFNAGTWVAGTTVLSPILSNPACGSTAAGVAICAAIIPNNRASSSKGP